MASSANTSVVVACDGFGEELKHAVVQHLKDKGFSVQDLGCDSFYQAAASVAKHVQVGPGRSTGMLFCGTGMGVSIVANKFEGVYAALAENEAAARNSRAINNANVLCLGGKVTSEADAARIADAFLGQGFVAQPDTFMAEFWSPQVEEFLKNTPEGIRKVEEAAREAQHRHARASTPRVARDDAREGAVSAATHVVVGCDGFGEELKHAVVQHLKDKGVVVHDLGCDSFYEAAASVAKHVQVGPGRSTGMLFCGTGMGVSIVANKFEGVYAALAENEAAARNSRAINNANVLCLGGKVTSEADAARIADAFLEQGFVAQPDTFMAEFWSPQVEEFLKSTPEGIRKIEEDALR